MENISKIFPVIVLYKSQLAEAVAYRTLLANNDFQKIMVYDNSPSDFIQQSFENPSRIEYVRDVNNGGLSKAYNTAAKFASQNGFTHLLILDQDTEFPETAIDVYKYCLEQNILCAPILITKNHSPFSPSQREGLRTKALSLSPGVYSLKKYMPVNSGMMIPIDLFKACGGYDDNVRLDFADYVFLSRYKLVDSKFRLMNLIAVQDFSNDEADIKKLQHRFLLYLQSAQATKWNSLKEKNLLWLDVIGHTIALISRTKKLTFLSLFFKQFFIPQIRF